MRMQKKNTSFKAWIALSLCFLIMMISIVSYLYTDKDKVKDHRITYTDIGFDTPITLYATCSDEQFDTYSNIVKETFSSYNKYFDIYHEYKGINNAYTINHEAYRHPIQVDQPLIDVLNISKEVYDISSKFDISQGQILSLWHKARETKILPSQEEINNAMQHSGWQNIEIKNDTISLLDPEMSLDFGGIAKGYTAMITKDKLNEAGLKNGYINAGGNVVLLGQKVDKTAWGIGIQDPDNQTSLLKLSLNKPCSIVTSGDYQRTVEINGKSYSHIIDPDTGYPATYARSVTIVHEDSAIADGLSTLLFCLDLKQGKQLATDLGISVVWIFDSNSIDNPNLKTSKYDIVYTKDLEKKISLS